MPTIKISTQDNLLMDISESNRLDIKTGGRLTTVDVYVHPERPANDGTRVVARDSEINTSAISDD